MKRIYNNSDVIFNIDRDKRIGHKFILKFYTTNQNFYIKRTSEDLIDGNLKINWNELAEIGDGVLNYVCNNLTEDQDFDDTVFNDTFSRTTEYYISSNYNVSENDGESFSDRLNYLENCDFICGDYA